MQAAGGRRATATAIRRFIKAFDQESGLTEFDRQEERCRYIHPRLSDAVLVRAAGGDLSGPECQAGAVRLAIQEVVIQLFDERSCIVDQISRDNYIIVDDREPGGGLTTE